MKETTTAILVLGFVILVALAGFAWLSDFNIFDLGKVGQALRMKPNINYGATQPKTQVLCGNLPVGSCRLIDKTCPVGMYHIAVDGKALDPSKDKCACVTSANLAAHVGFCKTADRSD